jgi:DNA-binding LacI/PurR family transcriptional regulator
VRTPIIEIGRAAARHLVARLKSEDFEFLERLPFELVLRGSTEPPR